MTSFLFISWCIGVVVSLSAFFMQPKYIFNRLNEYYFPNYSRDLTKKDYEFLDHHLYLIEKHQLLISKKKAPFIFGWMCHILIQFIMMAVFFKWLLLSPSLNDWLTDLIPNETYSSSFLVDPSPSLWTFLIAMFLGLTIWVPILQILLARKNVEKLTYKLLITSFGAKVGTEEFLDEIAQTLLTLIRERVLESHDNYSLDEILRSLIRNQAKHVRRFALASLALFFLVYIIDVFNFTKITNNKIIYSPAFSFNVTTKSFHEVTSAKYICKNGRDRRYLKLLVELDDGHQFRVRKFEIGKIKTVIDVAGISLGNINEADKWCENLKV